MDMGDELDDAVREQLSLGSFEVETVVHPETYHYLYATFRANSMSRILWEPSLSD